ncbi:hypothetical protein BLNAU_2183 [Blattamonas nauphoetae]|uniref:Uncharacterized protein n=1 Tax=Blattamonas nauphoetae TaxID=2049346 RepID=A0ABQ9YGG3_9EUKA|nr:hypothetical protein BLNAU_2183 [Blattamonas nauphoetae]
MGNLSPYPVGKSSELQIGIYAITGLHLLKEGKYYLRVIVGNDSMTSEWLNTKSILVLRSFHFRYLEDGSPIVIQLWTGPCCARNALVGEAVITYEEFPFKKKAYNLVLDTNTDSEMMNTVKVEVVYTPVTDITGHKNSFDLRSSEENGGIITPAAPHPSLLTPVTPVLPWYCLTQLPNPQQCIDDPNILHRFFAATLGAVTYNQAAIFTAARKKKAARLVVRGNDADFDEDKLKAEQELFLGSIQQLADSSLLGLEEQKEAALVEVNQRIRESNEGYRRERQEQERKNRRNQKDMFEEVEMDPATVKQDGKGQLSHQIDDSEEDYEEEDEDEEEGEVTKRTE